MMMMMMIMMMTMIMIMIMMIMMIIVIKALFIDGNHVITNEIFNRPSYGKVFTKKEYIQIYKIHD